VSLLEKKYQFLLTDPKPLNSSICHNRRHLHIELVDFSGQNIMIDSNGHNEGRTFFFILNFQCFWCNNLVLSAKKCSGLFRSSRAAIFVLQ